MDEKTSRNRQPEKRHNTPGDPSRSATSHEVAGESPFANRHSPLVAPESRFSNRHLAIRNARNSLQTNDGGHF